MKIYYKECGLLCILGNDIVEKKLFLLYVATDWYKLLMIKNTLCCLNLYAAKTIADKILSAIVFADEL